MGKLGWLTRVSNQPTYAAHSLVQQIPTGPGLRSSLDFFAFSGIGFPVYYVKAF